MIYNTEVEQTILGSFFLEPDIVKETLATPDMFDDRHKIVMDVIVKLRDKDVPVDLVTVVTELNNAGQLEYVGGVSYISRMATSVPTVANFKHYERILIDTYKMRKSYELANKFVNDVGVSRDPELINELAQEITNIQESLAVKKERTWRDTLMELVGDAYTDHEGITGIDTGFSEFNKMTDGLQGNNLIIIGARPSMGKTAFALNIGSNSCMLQDARVDIFSLETPEKRLAKRIISSVGNINAEYMRRMEFPNDQVLADFNTTVGIVDSYDLHIHDKSSVSVEEIRSIVADGNRKARQAGKKHLVIIDYLQLITYIGPLNNPVQQIGHISRSLKMIAGDFDIPVVALSQLSRAVEQRQDKRPMMSDIRESGNIEQDADLIGFLYRDDYYDKETENKNITEVIIAKNRDGAVGTVQLAFIKEYNKFVNLERRYDDAS